MVEPLEPIPVRHLDCPHGAQTVVVLTPEIIGILAREGGLTEIEHQTATAENTRGLVDPEGRRYAIADQFDRWTCPACNRTVDPEAG